MSEVVDEPASTGGAGEAGEAGEAPAPSGSPGSGPTPGRGRSKRSSRRARPPTAGDLWRPVPAPPAAEAVVPVGDPTALLRSLGDPPLHGQSTVAEHYLAAVVERAAALATALAAAAGVLAHPDGDEPA